MKRITSSILHIAFAGVLLLPLAAQAHAHLTRAVPANGSVVASAPASLSLDFNEAAKLTALSVGKQGDKAPQRIAPLPSAASSHFTLPLPKLSDGAYVIRYRVLSDDSHVMGGEIKFTVGTAAH